MPQFRVPAHVVRLLLLVGVIAVVTPWFGAPPPEAVVGLAVGALAGSWLVWRIACGRAGDRTGLVSDREFLRFLLASFCGATLSGLIAAATSAITGWSTPGIVGLAAGMATLASQLVIVPLFMRLQDRPTLASPAEVAALWGTTALITPLVFWSNEVPALVFLVIPTLVWGAVRVAPRHALWQVAAVAGIAITMTNLGFGRFAMSGGDLRLGGYEPDLFVELFIIACVLAVVPLLLNVGRQVDSARDAVAEADNLDQIMESALSVSIIGTDADGLVTFFSPGAQRLLGYDASEVLGRSTRMFHSPEEITAQAQELGVADDYSAVMKVFIDIPRLGPGRDLNFLCKDGQQRTHATSIVRTLDGHGDTSGFVITSDDVTERVQAQESLVQALNVERRGVDRLRQIDQIKDDLISTVSHELRTPITSIVGYVELFEDGAYGEVNDQQLRALERVNANSARLLTLIDKLLTLSRVEDGTHEVLDEMVDLREVLRSGFGIVATSLRTAGLDVRLDLPSVPVPFLGDGEMLERVVVNLIDNALKFTPVGGRVDVSLAACADDVVLTVIDTGIGIPADEQGLLFTRFFRSTLAKKQEIPGTGLGLSITRAVVEMHDGSVRVDSAPGVGTTFEVRLPRRRAGRPAAAPAPAPPPVPTSSGRSRRHEKERTARLTFEQLFPASTRRR